MAKQTRTNFSNENLDLLAIDQYYRHIEVSTRLYFSLSNPTADEVFAGKTRLEIAKMLEAVLKENDHLVSLNLLAAIEATFRVDYLQRCYKRKKDPLSRAFRIIHDAQGNGKNIRQLIQ